jgi:hypothetical protein
MSEDGYVYTGDEPSIEWLWSKSEGPRVASITHYGDHFWISVHGQAMELTKSEVLELVRSVGNEVNRP